MTGHVVARAAGLLVVEVPCVFIVASNLLCTTCQQQQRQRQHPLLQLHFAGLFPVLFLSFFFFVFGFLFRGGVGTLAIAQTSIGLLRVVFYFSFPVAAAAAAAELENVFDSVC